MARIKTRRPKGVGGTSRGHVEVLLAEDVANLGEQGEIVRVKPGYARNYLLPHGLATVATEHNKRMVELHKQKLGEIREARLKEIRKLAEDISNYNVTLEANANEDGQLYGSILAQDIAAALKKADYAVEADHIKLEGPLKVLGMYTVDVQLAPEVKTDLKVWVVPSATAASR